MRVTVRRVWFGLLARTLNPLTLRLAPAGVGPFTIVRHRGRRTGRMLETPIIVARWGPDFVVELTDGDRVQWYRNVVAAGGRELVRGTASSVAVGVEPMSPEAGLAAFGGLQAVVLRLLKRHEFRWFVTARD